MSDIAELLRAAELKKTEKAKLELVPSQHLVNQNSAELLTKDITNVNQKNIETLTKTAKEVNQTSTKKLTKNENLVNQDIQNALTNNSSDVNKLTKNTELLTKQTTANVNKLTKNEDLVNQKNTHSSKWKGYDKERTGNFNVVEGFRSSEAFKQEVKEFCAKYKINKQDFYHHAATQYMESLVNQNSGELVNKLTLDDRRLRTLYKTKPSIIYLYSAYAENSRWSANDDAKAFALNEVDIRIVELGILQTLGNRKQKGKINSFGYFLPEINNFLEIEMPDEGINAMLEINRKRLQQMTGKLVDLSFLGD